MRIQKLSILLVGAALSIGFAPLASAVPFSIQIGDNDGFGFGAGLVPDGADLLNINLPEDRRSVGEAAATNGAQQTDFYSAAFTPLADPFDVIFPFVGVMNSGTLTIDMGGFQASQFGQLSVAFNGVAQPGLFNFQDGAFETAVRSFVLGPAALANANLAGEFRMTVGRGGSTDAIAFDYFQLDGDINEVPEPATVLLLGAGLLTGALRRRRA